MKIKKSILLCMPSNFGISGPIIKSLQDEGYMVYDYQIRDLPYKFKHLLQPLNKIIRKVFFNDYTYYQKLKMKDRNKELSIFLEKIPHIDYALFIRPDLFPIEFITTIKNRVKKIVGYQWDGLDRFPDVYKCITLFDRFFVFDKQDTSIQNTLFTTNFYINNIVQETTNKTMTAFYIGSHQINRIETIRSIDEKLEPLGIVRDISIVSKKEQIIRQIEQNNFKAITEEIPYNDSLKKVLDSKILIDIQNPVHKGLSFRIFEAIGYNKKLITTNHEVIKYDFYHPNNILIWNNQTTEELVKFINSPFFTIDPKVKEKYCFSNWLKYVLDESEYIPITSPI